MITHSKTLHYSSVSLSAVTDSNRHLVTNVERASTQKDFIPDVASSLEGLERYPDARPIAITFNSEIVGFALYGVDETTGSWKIFRLLIDKQYQGRGFGKQALELIVIEMRNTRGATDILICYDENNEVARRMYLSFGFEEYDKDGSKILARLLN